MVTARNVNEALRDGLWLLRSVGKVADSRNGRVLRAPSPVATTYQVPEEKVLFWNRRDANPFFHVMETIWMLAGRDDLAWIEQFNSGMRNYAEDEGYIHGAYGFRWRRLFQDQVVGVIDLLRKDRNTRRAVIQMWSADEDLGKNKKDLPCNTTIYFSVQDARLCMTVCCRSNDIIWGAYGANAVHFAFLHEFISGAVGIPMGEYVQFSNDYHMYLDQGQGSNLIECPISDDRYCNPGVFVFSQAARHYPIYDHSMSTEQNLLSFEAFTADHTRSYSHHFLDSIAKPMALWYLSRKEDNENLLLDMPETDWKIAALEWRDRWIRRTK